ncbi:uridine kinase [Trifolium repens]|nr:uridine kinase [Trifolium repens]
MVSVICLSPKSKLPLQQDLPVLVLISERNYTVFQLFEDQVKILWKQICCPISDTILNDSNRTTNSGKPY